VILPNVSHCAQENELHYNPIDPYNGHEYVDLGLPSGTKWATMNVGATSETDYGLYFQWGDTQGYTSEQVGSGEGQKAFTWTDYKYSDNGSSSVMTKYNATDGKTLLDLEDDSVAANWGGNWRMPTLKQFRELLDNTEKRWTTVNNVEGYKFTNKTDSSKYIFIPAAGLARNGSVDYVGYGGYVWSSSISSDYVDSGSYLTCNSDYVDVGSYSRYYGLSVRGVVGGDFSGGGAEGDDEIVG
jgi:hypothetical protein